MSPDSTNVYEILLSLALDQSSLTYERAVPLGSYWVDFLVEGKLYVEVDGSYHNREDCKARDKKKESLMDMPLVRLSTQRVATDLDSCVAEIKTLLSNL